MMDELIEQVMKKTGISEINAKQAVETVFNFLKEKLPEPLGSQIEGFLSGDLLEQAEDLLGGLGEMLGQG
jgi:nucleoid DNA-binding protein